MCVLRVGSALKVVHLKLLSPFHIFMHTITGRKVDYAIVTGKKEDEAITLG